MSAPESPLDRLPQPATIHRHIGRLCLELALLRKLLRLAQAARQERASVSAERQEARHAE